MCCAGVTACDCTALCPGVWHAHWGTWQLLCTSSQLPITVALPSTRTYMQHRIGPLLSQFNHSILTL